MLNVPRKPIQGAGNETQGLLTHFGAIEMIGSFEKRVG